VAFPKEQGCTREDGNLEMSVKAVQ